MHRHSESGERLLDIEYSVGEHGYVSLIDYMGNDDRIVEAARQSTTGDVKDPETDRALIRYMLDCSHRPHTSPFEMVETVWKVRMPIFVARQWVRHRTASLNEYSGRYSVMPEEAFIPTIDRLRRGGQNTVNKQGSAPINVDAEEFLEYLQDEMITCQEELFEHYKGNLDGGLSKELARINLPISLYTTWMWKIDLHNLFHFLWLRTDGDAQEEIRVYADIMERTVASIVPVAYEAWVDFKKEAITLSRIQREALLALVAASQAEDATEETHLTLRDAVRAAVGIKG